MFNENSLPRIGRHQAEREDASSVPLTILVNNITRKEKNIV
jgi:hypothetical protein